MATQKKLEPVTGIGYSCWASYLINGDASGIEDSERAAADAFAEYMGGPIVSCGDDEFFGTPDAGGNLRGDCVEYTALIEAECSCGEGYINGMCVYHGSEE